MSLPAIPHAGADGVIGLPRADLRRRRVAARLRAVHVNADAGEARLDRRRRVAEIVIPARPGIGLELDAVLLELERIAGARPERAAQRREALALDRQVQAVGAALGEAVAL